MRTFVNTEVTKEEVLANLAEHRKTFQPIKLGGFYVKRDYSVGHTIHDFLPEFDDDRAAAYEPLFGIPFDLAFLENAIFYNLSLEASQTWPERFITAVPIGADLTLTVRKFVHWILSGDDSPIAKWRDNPHIMTVRWLYERELYDIHNIPTQAEWYAARKAAQSAVSAAADATTPASDSLWRICSVAENAADAERDVILNVADTVAWDATRAGTTEWNTAKNAAIETMADKLIELIEQAPT